MSSSAVSSTDLPRGFEVPGWQPVEPPPRAPMVGRTCTLEPLDAARHGRALFDALAEDREGRLWTYLTHGPYETFEAYRPWLAQAESSTDPLFFAIIDNASGAAVGVASYLRITPAQGVIEVGHICYTPRLVRTTAATEAMMLMMRQVFEGLGYRRYEWKCDAMNAKSRAAAERLGFTFEGVFRQAMVNKGRNRDTAWYSITDREWPAIDAAHRAWLDPANFDEAGRQRQSLRDLVAESRLRHAAGG